MGDNVYQRMKENMNGVRQLGKRFLSVALAAAMSVTAIGTQAFASNEADEKNTVTETGLVVSWSWPEGTTLAWSEEEQAWALSCVYSEAQPLTEKTLDQLLPDQIDAVIQPEIATAETALAEPESDPDTETTVTTEDVVAVEENAATFESAATPDTAASDGEEETSSVPEEDTIVSEEMEADTVGTVSNQPQTLTLDLTWDFTGLTFPLQVGQYSFSASLPQGYQLDQNAPSLKMTLTVTGAVRMMRAKANSVVSSNDVITDTVSPVGTTINLFDYWMDVPGKDGTAYAVNAGINKDHTLKFTQANGTGSQDAGVTLKKSICLKVERTRTIIKSQNKVLFGIHLWMDILTFNRTQSCKFLKTK